MAHTRATFGVSYFDHGMIPGSQRLIQHLQPMESMNSSQLWPMTTYVRYSQADHVRIMRIVPVPCEARNKGYQVFSGSSKYMAKALGGTLHSISYSWKVHWRVLNGDNYTQDEVLQMSILMKERRLIGRR